MDAAPRFDGAGLAGSVGGHGAEDEELEALYSAVFDVQVRQFKPAVLWAVGL